MDSLAQLMDDLLQDDNSEETKTLAIEEILDLSREESNIQEIALASEFLSTMVEQLENKLLRSALSAWEPPKRKNALIVLAEWLKGAIYRNTHSSAKRRLSTHKKFDLLTLQTLSELSKDELASQFMFDCPGLVEVVMEYAESNDAEISLACITILGNLSLELQNKRMLFRQYGMSDLLLHLEHCTLTIAPALFLLHRSLAVDFFNRWEMVLSPEMVNVLVRLAVNPPQPQIATLAKLSLTSLLLDDAPHNHRNAGDSALTFWQSTLAVWALQANKKTPLRRLPKEMFQLVFLTLNGRKRI